ncbi:hypothetical protein B566_EDAN006555 [Ephemera danica]|nr:hypothetical protein B566_EDAN006555 [Ephemera danica]
MKVDTKVSKKNSETTDNSKRDSHNVSTSEANRYDQHYQASNSGNVEKKSVTNTDESNRSSTRTATNIDKSYHVHITNSIFQSTLSGASDQSSQPAIGASNLPAVEDLFHRTPVASPAPESKEASPAHELKLEILYSKMSAEMEEWALDICSAAFVRKTDAMSRAKHVCESFEKQCGGSWNCVVGSEGNFVRYEENLYIQLKIGNQRVIAFKAPDKTEITRLQDQLLKVSRMCVCVCN